MYIPKVKLPSMSEHEVNNVINEEYICRIAFIDNNYPYIAPFQYVFLNNDLYFHFTDYGKKKKILTKNSEVCVSIEKLENNLEDFYFITLQGSLTEVKDIDEKIEIINQMVKDGKKKFSDKFLAAHGFKSEDGWDVLKNNKDLRIYKLVDIIKKIGLKAPSS